MHEHRLPAHIALPEQLDVPASDIGQQAVPTVPHAHSKGPPSPTGQERPALHVFPPQHASLGPPQEQRLLALHERFALHGRAPGQHGAWLLPQAAHAPFTQVVPCAHGELHGTLPSPAAPLSPLDTGLSPPPLGPSLVPGAPSPLPVTVASGGSVTITSFAPGGGGATMTPAVTSVGAAQ
jgi:hypothetical protein